MINIKGVSWGGEGERPPGKAETVPYWPKLESGVLNPSLILVSNRLSSRFQSGHTAKRL